MLCHQCMYVYVSKFDVLYLVGGQLLYIGFPNKARITVIKYNLTKMLKVKEMVMVF